jgi:hypothetical protein
MCIGGRRVSPSGPIPFSRTRSPSVTCRHPRVVGNKHRRAATVNERYKPEGRSVRKREFAEDQGKPMRSQHLCCFFVRRREENIATARLEIVLKNRSISCAVGHKKNCPGAPIHSRLGSRLVRPLNNETYRNTIWLARRPEASLDTYIASRYISGTRTRSRVPRVEAGRGSLTPLGPHQLPGRCLMGSNRNIPQKGESPRCERGLSS